MINDRAYNFFAHNFNELEHKYGDNVHILSTPYLMSLLTRFSHPKTVQPALNKIIEKIYSNLMIEVCNKYLPKKEISSDTRMKEYSARGVYSGDILDSETKLVIVDLARAGILPSHICCETLFDFLKSSNVRQDHFFMNRKVNNQGEVIGVDVSGSKIGGTVEDSYVLFPDPMGATGGSLSHCISHYKDNVDGKAKKYIALHLIITPEYIKKIQHDHDDVEIFAVRLDRGLSDNEVLKTIPGTHPNKEIGLNEIQYIVPGAGGVGEILNNSFV